MVFIVIMALMGLFGGSAFCEAPQDKSLMRDLIIILDDFEATAPDKNWAAIWDLQNAVESEAAPILFNASLWRTFIEARQEWLLQAQIPDTNEYKCTALKNQINERANYWYTVLSEQGGDDIHIRALMGDKINEEFYTKESFERLRKEGIIPQNVASRYCNNMRHCATIPYHFDRWYWFYLDSGYYVAVPKHYCEQFTSSTDLSEIMRAVGFNTSLALHSVDPLVVEPSLELNLPTVDATIIVALQELFLHKKYTEGECRWFVKIMGHGQRWKHPCVFFQEVAGITPERFKELCVFLDNHIAMHMLYVVSCHAGGANRLHLTDGGTTYTYPIVIACVGENAVRAWRDAYDLLPNGECQCKGYHFKKNAETNKWELFYEPSQRFRKFFEKLHEIEDIALVKDYVSIQQALYNAFTMICYQSGVILAIPHILVPNSTKWLLCYENTMTYINAQSALLAEVCNVVQPIRTRYLLIDAPILTAGLQIVGKSVESIVMMSPGDTVHYCKALQAPAYFTNELLNCFGSELPRSCNKQFLCDEITCQCDPKDPFIQMLGVTEKTITFKDVLINIIKNEEIKLVFTTPNNEVFYAVGRAVDGKPMLRNLQKLSAAATNSYRAYYDKTKTELLAQSEEAYAPLRNHYLQAMKKDQQQEQVVAA